VQLQQAPSSVAFDRDTRFHSGFWQKLQEAFGTLLLFSTTFHPATNGQTEGTIQTLEDMLRAYALDFKKAWDEQLVLIEFSYNNSYNAIIGMAPYGALCGGKCRTPLYWQEIDEALNIGPELIKSHQDKIRVIQERMRVAQSRQKSYADRRRRPLEFQVGDQVFLRVFPTKGIARFDMIGKLSTRYIWSYPIVQTIGELAYRLELPQELPRVHNVFHVSQLQKYIPDPSHVIEHDPIQF